MNIWYPLSFPIRSRWIVQTELAKGWRWRVILSSSRYQGPNCICGMWVAILPCTDQQQEGEWTTTDVLPPNLVKSRSREIGCYDERIFLQFDRQLGSAAAEVPVKFQIDCKSLNPNLAASRLREIIRWDVRPLSEYRPWVLTWGERYQYDSLLK